eukprot:1800465-Pyramimonas_sp.AAC.1
MDFASVSGNCLPHIHNASAVTDAPWSPQCGVDIHLRGVGQQLLMRSLEVAPRLPQVPRPLISTTAGSKSSKAKL